MRRDGPASSRCSLPVGALLGLGARSLDLSFDDDEALTDVAFYYARAFQVDGELAWSSPIWVQPGE